MNTNCPCDAINFPPARRIPAGLARLPRQIATFPEFRAAMLASIPSQTPLANWRAREGDDFGIMLLEMWAYICDCLSFYDEVIADELYLRTATQRASLRKLVGLLGYVPRPAIAAAVNLALFAEGRQPLIVPAGVAFRSGAFPGGAPQVFELDADTKVHPFHNQWSLVPTRRTTLNGGQNITSLLLDRKTITIKKGQALLFEVVGANPKTQARILTNVSDFAAPDGATYKKIEWDEEFSVAGNTPIAQVRLSKAGQTASLTSYSDLAGLGPIGNRSIPHGKQRVGRGFLHLDGTYHSIRVHQPVVVVKDAEARRFRVSAVTDIQVQAAVGVTTQIKDAAGHLTATVTSPPSTVTVTQVVLDAMINHSGRKHAGSADWSSADAGSITVHFGFTDAGTVVAPASTTLEPGDPTLLRRPFDVPQDNASPNRFLLEDKNNNAVGLGGGIDYPAAVLTLAQNSPLKSAFTVPVQIYGNVATASRGETVPSEILGGGDAAVASQSFTLKKKPLTYVPSPTAGNQQAAASTLTIRVSGIRWCEVPSFFGVRPDAQVYIVRQDDDGNSVVTFGDGIRGARLPSGVDNVVAAYRFGAGKLAPPSGSIHQFAKPFKGLKTVRNPVTAVGGDDAEPASGLRTYAPRSALLLGRAISILDMEAAAAGNGVRAVRAEWRWNEVRQQPVVQIWYVGDPALAPVMAQKLQALSDPSTPIVVDAAQPVIGTLSISIETDERRLEGDVLAAVRATLMNPDTGLLAPERVGIGLPLFRSQIFEAVLAVEGALAVTGLMWNGNNFDPYGRKPGAGKYFDVEKGTLLLNGKAA
jgi:uncharacterized phage protein gp47/JayE